MTTFGIGMMAAPVSCARPRRLDHRDLELAMEFLHQPPDGRIRSVDGLRGTVRDPAYLRKQSGTGKVDYAGIALVTIKDWAYSRSCWDAADMMVGLLPPGSDMQSPLQRFR